METLTTAPTGIDERPRLRPRQPAWRSRLVAIADETAGRPRLWGDTDCGTLALRALAALTTQSLVDVRECLGVPVYLSPLGAARMAAAIDPARRFADAGLRAVPPGLLQDGDLVAWPAREGSTLPGFGVAISGKLLTALEPDGVVGWLGREAAYEAHATVWRHG